MIQNQWYGILPSKEVKSGKLVGVIRLDKKLCLFRDKQNHIQCIADKCSHRGASLSAGCHQGDHLACPFHGLEFDGQGQCICIPANGREAKVENRYHVKSYLVREAHGMIYLWNGDPALATEELPFFEKYIDDTYSYSELADLWKTHYSRCIENQLDVVHVPFVHYNTIGRGHKTVVNGPPISFTDKRITLSANNALDQGQPPLPAAECQINPEQFLEFCFPNVWMNYIAPHIKVVIFFAPIDEEQTMLYIRFYTNMSRFSFINRLVAYFGKFANKKIERQDKRVVETQIPKASGLSIGENLLKGDSPVIQYRKMRAAFQKSVPTSETLENTEKG